MAAGAGRRRSSMAFRTSLTPLASTERYLDVVRSPVVPQRYYPSRHRLIVHRDGPDAPARASRVLHADAVRRGPVAVGDLVTRPARWDERLEAEPVASQAEAEIASRATRYSQLADPVYQDQPPRPV